MTTSLFDPNHGLLIADNGNINQAPCTINNFALKNADRAQVTVTLPGSTVHVPALTAMREWVRRAVRTPKGPLRGTASRPGVNLQQVAQGRNALRPVVRRLPLRRQVDRQHRRRRRRRPRPTS